MSSLSDWVKFSMSAPSSNSFSVDAGPGSHVFGSDHFKELLKRLAHIIFLQQSKTKVTVVNRKHLAFYRSWKDQLIFRTLPFKEHSYPLLGIFQRPCSHCQRAPTHECRVRITKPLQVAPTAGFRKGVVNELVNYSWIDWDSGESWSLRAKQSIWMRRLQHNAAHKECKNFCVVP